MRLLFCLLLPLAISTTLLPAQKPTLSLDQAITTVIEKNLAINIQRLNSKISENNVFKANAGQLPEINLLGSLTYANNFTDLTLRTFQPEPPTIEIDESGVENLTGVLGIQTDYVIIDGGASNYRYQLLKEQSNLAKAEQEVLINETILVVSNLYLEITKLQNQASFLRENIANTQARLQKVKDRKSFGKATGLDILQLSTTLNQDEAALDDVILAQQNLIKDLNFLMNATTNNDYDFLPVIIPDEISDLEAIQTNILANNPQLILSNTGINLAQNEINLNKSGRKPILSAYANLGYYYQRNDLQQLAEIQNIGLTFGLNASYNLFDGGINKKRIENAEMNFNLEQLKQDELERSLFNEANKVFNEQVILKSQLSREIQNLETFKEAYNRTQESFDAGKANNLALRDAQLAKLNVQLRIDQLKVDIVKSHFKLLKLQGKLVN